MGRGRRRGEMREARRRDHARRGAEARPGRTDGRELRPRRPHQEFIHFQVSFCKFCSSGSTWWPLTACTSFENMHYRIDFIDVFDALIDSMLDHRTDTKNQKTSVTLHGNAPAKNGTSVALHGNAFCAFMVQSGASKSSPGDRTKHSFSGVVLRFLFLGTHLLAAPGMHSS